MVFSLQGRPHSPARIRSVRRTIRVVVPPVKIRAGRPVDRLTYRIPGTALAFQVQLTSPCTWIESESSPTKLHFILHPSSFLDQFANLPMVSKRIHNPPDSPAVLIAYIPND